MKIGFMMLVHLIGILVIAFILNQYDWTQLFYNSEINVLWCVLLLPFNIFLESIKMKEASSLSLIESVQVVFRGYLGQLISPFGPGILLGRMIYLPFQKTGSVLSASIISSVCQTLITWTVGLFGFGLLYQNFHIEWVNLNPMELMMFVGSATIFLLILIFGFIIYSKKIIGIQITNTLIELKTLSNLVWYRQLGLSLIRYLLYTSQFMILLAPFYAGTWWVLWMPVSCVFLLQSLVNLPSYGNLLVRTGASTLIFTQCGMEASHAIGASGLLLIINKVIPALAGGLLILKDFRTHCLKKLFTTT
ncbi:MAG: hypothetical protein IPH93_01640 [Saprospiraceae bacterium]|nr:hypothetical protein [Saprospiraceae bacterium]MBK7810206.1 hypothetical protein [Saprospiraceae bacterium]MBK9629810.1 hypothetical protein [Saprospiraceae bacterium]